MAAAISFRFKVHPRIDVAARIWYPDSVNPKYFEVAKGPFSLWVVLLPSLVFFVAARRAAAETPPLPTLTSVRQVRDVTPEQAAKGYPVRLRGVVTFCEATYDLGMFIHDATGGIYVKLGEGTNDFNAGDDVEIEGQSGPGDFLPVVLAEQVKVLGRAALPTPDPVTYARLAAGSEDSQWVELRGEVRSVLPSVRGHILIDLLADGQRISALVARFDPTDAEKLIAATVRVRGVCRTSFNNRRQMRAPFLSVTSSDDMIVEAPATEGTVEVPLAKLFQFKSEGYYGRRVRVQAVVTEQKAGSLIIQEQGEGLSVKTHQTNLFLPGDLVAVTGFPTVGEYLPVLEDAVVQRLGHGVPPAPVPVRIDQLMSENYDGVLICVRGRLMNRTQRADEQVLVLEAENLILRARVIAANTDRRFNKLRIGSEVEVTGVCLPQPMENWNPSIETHPESFQLL
jgi:hypothetical protein